jgi:hypothetical protein
MVPPCEARGADAFAAFAGLIHRAAGEGPAHGAASLVRLRGHRVVEVDHRASQWGQEPVRD